MLAAAKLMTRRDMVRGPREQSKTGIARARDTSGGPTRKKMFAAVALIAAFVLWVHLGSGIPVFRSEVPPEPGWEKFRADYRIDFFGADGQFVRAVQNGYNLVFYTYKYAPRFTRKTAS